MPAGFENHPFNVAGILHNDWHFQRSDFYTYDNSMYEGTKQLSYSYSINATAEFRDIYDAAFAELASFLAVDFYPAADEAPLSDGAGEFQRGPLDDTSADLRLSQQTSGTRGGGFAGYYIWDTNGDTDVDDIDAYNQIWTVNHYTILHELGHALGLKHTSPGQAPDQAPYIEAQYQNANYTVMHYVLEADGSNDWDPAQGDWDYRHFQLLDVYALQLRYGADTSTYAGNSTHTAASLGAGEWLKVLWDASGADTIDMSAQTRNQLIDLREGGFSNLGAVAGNNPLGHNLAIAFNAQIENAVGGSGNDILYGNGFANTLDGRQGADEMTGFGGDDIYYVDSLLDEVFEEAGGGTDEVRTSAGLNTPLHDQVYYLPANVENLTGTSTGAQAVFDNALDNVIKMGGGNDLIGLDGGGNDTVEADGGNDFLYYGAALTAADKNDGGAGVDTVGLLGTYSLTFGALSLVNIDKLAMYTGAAGAPANNYTITTIDANVASGAQLFVTAAGLQANETLTFLGNAETNGTFVVHGGGGSDFIVGGAGGDYLIGNPGNDTLYGLAGIDTLVGGPGADQLRGGAALDYFRYLSTAESTTGGVDQILDFQAGERIDLSAIDANGNAGDGDTAFAFIGASAFSGTAGELRAYQSGGSWFVEGDTNGDGFAELVIGVTTIGGHALASGDFLL